MIGKILSSNRIFILLITSTAFFLSYFQRLSIAVISPDLIQEFSLKAVELGFLSSAFFYATAAMLIPVGIFSDYAGPKKTISIFLSLMTLGCLCFTFAPDFNIATASRVLMGVGASSIFVCSVKIVSNWFRSNEFSSYVGIIILFGNLGGLGAAMPLALFTEAMGWRSAFLFLSIASATTTIMSWIFIRDKPPGYKETTVRPQKFLSQFRAISANKQILRLVFIQLSCYSTLMGLQGVWGVPYLMDVYRFSKSEASIAITFIAIGFCISAPLAGFLSDRIFHARKNLMSNGVLLYTFAWLAIVIAIDKIPRSGLYMLSFSLGFLFGFIALAVTMTRESVPIQSIGTAIGYQSMFPMLGVAILQPIMGAVLDSIGVTPIGGAFPTLAYRYAFSICLALNVFAFLISLSLTETYRD